MFRQALLFLHVVSVIVWVGGMFFAYFCLRPAATRLLEPSQRLPLWLATFASFFRFVAVAVLVILGSGFAMLADAGFGSAPWGWYAMLSFGLAMAVVFAYVYAVLYPRLRAHCSTSAWAAAGAALNSIRRLVALNLALAVCAIACAVWSR